MRALLPTMKTVAARAGVSVMTVSRALRNQPNLPEKTRLRVQRIAKEMGYRPNPMISTLMAQLRGSRPHKDVPCICYLTAYPDPEHWKDLFYNVDAFHGALARAEDLGYRLEHFCLTEPGMTFKRAWRILRNRGVVGVLIAPLPDPPPPKLDFKWEAFACAEIGSSVKEPKFHSAKVDHFAAMRLTYSSLRDLGYRRIGLALHITDDHEVDNKWLAGYNIEQLAEPEACRVPTLVATDWRQEIFGKWFLKHRPDAVITMRVDVKEWLTKMGFDVPREVGVAMPDISWGKMYPGISGVDQRTKLVGAIAVDLVVEQINHNERGIPKVPKTVLVQGFWVLGENVLRQERKGGRAPAKASLRLT